MEWPSQHYVEHLYAVHGITARARASPRRRWIGRAFAGVARSLRGRLQTQRALADLPSLDDGMLRDIGINRSEIPYVKRYGRSADHVSFRKATW
jgi:uncharacterized protein YjiS (DUF1127 family)